MRRHIEEKHGIKGIDISYAKHMSTRCSHLLVNANTRQQVTDEEIKAGRRYVSRFYICEAYANAKIVQLFILFCMESGATMAFSMSQLSEYSFYICVAYANFNLVFLLVTRCTLWLPNFLTRRRKHTIYICQTYVRS